MHIRIKASVHSGAFNDSLNDCNSGYCLRFEEHHYMRDTFEAEDEKRNVPLRTW